MDRDVALSEDTAAAWRVVGAAVQGVSHQKADLPCQDAQGYRVLPGGILLIAVADGAGSSELSELGAACAVEAALLALSSALSREAPQEPATWEDLLRCAYEKARQALERLAQALDEPLRAFATTLALAAVSDRLVAGQLGDGAVVAQDVSGSLFAAAHAQRGEYANETNFLTGEGALEQVEIQVFDRPVQAVAVMSDGLVRLAMSLPSHAPHLPFFQPLFSFTAAYQSGAEAESQLAAFLASERVCARTDDDKALVLAVRAGSNGSRVDE